MKQLIERLETEWDSDGFLGQLRLGKITSEEAVRFLQFLREIEIDEQEAIPKRALSLLWYLPSFLAWQRERVKEKGGDIDAYAHFVTDVYNVLEEVLGVP